MHTPACAIPQRVTTLRLNYQRWEIILNRIRTNIIFII